MKAALLAKNRTVVSSRTNDEQNSKKGGSRGSGSGQRQAEIGAERERKRDGQVEREAEEKRQRKRERDQVSKREREIWVRGWTGRNIDPATSR